MFFLCTGTGFSMSVTVSWLSPGSLKAARAASTVLYNMFQYNKLHKDYKLVRSTAPFITICADNTNTDNSIV